VKQTLELLGELLERLAARETSAEVLKRFDAVMEAVRRREHATRNYALRAARIGEMELELADAKIAARVSGLMSDGARNGDVIGAIESQVEGVLQRSSQFGTMLEQTLRELEEEIAERELAARAKAVLQGAYSMSEEQAHLHLRQISRKSRRPVKEVAREVIGEATAVCLNPR
jgi:AmiR/NasT family two-component response regulator